jgi:hypothetical protein
LQISPVLAGDEPLFKNRDIDKLTSIVVKIIKSGFSGGI